MWRWVKRLLLVVLLLLVALVVNRIWFKPIFSRVFYERVFLEFGLQSPELLSQLRLLESVGLRGHNAELDDRSPAAADRQFAKLKADLATLQSYDRSAMTEAEKLNYDMLEWFMQHQVEGEKWRYHGYPVNQLFGVQSMLPRFMVNTHQLKDKTDAEQYINRLQQFDRVFSQVVDDLNLRAAKGVLPPRFVLEKVLAEVKGLTSGEVEQQLLYTHFTDSINHIPSLTDAERADLSAQVKTALEQAVLPGFNRLTGYLTDVAAAATTDDGVWKLPDGAAYYAYLLKEHTTTDLTPEQIHQLGLSEVARIQQQMLQILRAQGIAGDQLASVMKTLGDDPRFLYADSQAGREQILADYKTILADIDLRLGNAFHIRPKAPMDVQRVPEFAEKTSPGAY